MEAGSVVSGFVSAAAALLAFAIGRSWARLLSPATRTDRWSYAAVTALAFALGFRTGGPDSALAVALSASFVVIATIDGATRLIPIAAAAAAAAIGLVRAVLVGDAAASVVGGLVGAALFAALWLLARMGRVRRGADPLGSGDVMLAAAVGTAAAWPSVLGVLFLGSLLAAAYAGWLLLARRAAPGDPLPFGVFLSLAAVGHIALAT